MPRPHRPPALRGAVFRKRDVLASGLLTTDALRSSAWRRLFQGVYADADLPDTFGVRVRGARLALPDFAVFSGRTAAFLHGATELADLRTPVEVTVPAGTRCGAVAGIRVRRALLTAPEVVSVRGWRCTTPARTAWDVARWEALPDAVAAVDVLLARAVVGKAELGEEVGRRSGRGVRKAQTVVDLADARAESQPESRLRVLLALAGMPAVPQHTVRDASGEFVARVDLAYPELRIAIEYDGAWHGEAGQLSRDRRRHNRLVAAGWTVFYVTAADMRDPAGLLARIRAWLAAPTAGK